MFPGCGRWPYPGYEIHDSTADKTGTEVAKPLNYLRHGFGHVAAKRVSAMLSPG